MNKTEETDFCRYICFDRMINYVYKNRFKFEMIEMLFVDRYLGFDFDEQNRDYDNHSDGLKDYLYREQIIEESKVDSHVYFQELKASVLGQGHLAASLAEFVYPDQTERFSFISYIIIEAIEKDEIILTSLLNIGQNFRFRYTFEKFLEISQKNNNQICLIALKKCLAQNLGLNEKPNFSNVLQGLFQYNFQQLEHLYSTHRNSDEILLISRFHADNYQSYMDQGINRKLYSHFVKKIQELLNPSLDCLKLMHNLGLVIDINLIEVAKELELQLNNAEKHILMFFHLKKEENFMNYLKYMNLANTIHASYKELYHDNLIKILASEQ